MYDAGPRSQMQRARGELEVVWKRRERRTVLARLRQKGCLKARFPHPLFEEVAEAVLLNVSGGVAAGDLLSVRMEARPGTSVSVATQAAERLYRALPGSAPARVRNRLSVASGARFEWLPQETILFDGCALDRELEVDMAEFASVLCVESLVFGRVAMGEQVGRASVRDVIRLVRGGRVTLHDAIRLNGEAARVLDRPATGGGARAVATLVYAATDAESRCEGLRSAFAEVPAECGASAWDGMLVARIVAGDGARLRAAIVAGLSVLRDAPALPRVWMC